MQGVGFQYGYGYGNNQAMQQQQNEQLMNNQKTQQTNDVSYFFV